MTITIFANQSGQIPLASLDGNFATPITLGLTTMALGQTVSTVDSLTLSNASLGTPASGTLTNCTFPILNQNTTGTAANVTTNANLTGMVTSVGNTASLGSFTSANLSTALTDETGTGAAVFATSPTLVTPALGTPASGTLTNCTFPTLNQNTTGTAANVTGTVAVANGGTGVTTSTGSGSAVLSSSPTLVTPALGTPASGNLSSCTVDGTNAVGFRHVPQNLQTASYTCVLADAGKHMFNTVSGVNWTIPANGSVAYPIGTVLTFINGNSASSTIAITTDTLQLVNTTTTGLRTLATNGMATAIKVTATKWYISGLGLT